MSAKEDFPELWRFTRKDFPNMYGVFNVYDKGEVKDWIKRCIKDFPEQRDSTFMEEDIWAYNHWFEKWFSQFRNKSE